MQNFYEKQQFVEKITGKRFNNDARRYEQLVKWENQDEPTWEPKNNLMKDAPKLVEDQEAQQRNHKNGQIYNLMETENDLSNQLSMSSDKTQLINEDCTKEEKITATNQSNDDDNLKRKRTEEIQDFKINFHENIDLKQEKKSEQKIKKEKDLWQCIYCNYTSKSKKIVQKHENEKCLQKNKNEKKILWQCEFCQFTSNSQNIIENHEIKCQNKNKKDDKVYVNQIDSKLINKDDYELNKTSNQKTKLQIDSKYIITNSKEQITNLVESKNKNQQINEQENNIINTINNFSKKSFNDRQETKETYKEYNIIDKINNLSKNINPIIDKNISKTSINQPINNYSNNTIDVIIDNKSTQINITQLNSNKTSNTNTQNTNTQITIQVKKEISNNDDQNYVDLTKSENENETELNKNELTTHRSNNVIKSKSSVNLKNKSKKIDNQDKFNLLNKQQKNDIDNESIISNTDTESDEYLIPVSKNNDNKANIEKLNDNKEKIQDLEKLYITNNNEKHDKKIIKSKNINDIYKVEKQYESKNEEIDEITKMQESYEIKNKNINEISRIEKQDDRKKIGLSHIEKFNYLKNSNQNNIQIENIDYNSDWPTKILRAYSYGLSNSVFQILFEVDRNNIKYQKFAFCHFNKIIQQINYIEKQISQKNKQQYILENIASILQNYFIYREDKDIIQERDQISNKLIYKNIPRNSITNLNKDICLILGIIEKIYKKIR